MTRGIIILMFYCHFANAQFINKAIDYNQDVQIPRSVLEEDSGYTIMGFGRNRPLIGGWRGCVIMKTDSIGNVISDRFYGKSGHTHTAGIMGSFIELEQGGYAVGIGQYDTARGNYDAMLIRYNENGDTVFVKNFDRNGDERGYQVKETPDRGFALAAQANGSFGNFYLIKTDSSGILEWEKVYPQPNSARALSIVNAHNGGYVLSGWGATPGRSYDTYVKKVDSLGNQEWDKYYGSLNEDCGGIITTSSDSAYIVTTCLDTLAGLSLNTYSVLKIDLEGNPMWQYYYFTDKVHILNMTREVAPGKGYISVGMVYDSLSGAYNEAGLLLRFDSDGNILWERRYAYFSNFFNRFRFSRLFDVQPTRDGGFVCLGETAETNHSDFWLLKVDSLGCMGDYCGLTDTNCYYKPYPNCEDDTVDVGEVASIAYQDIRLRVYPNPANEVVYFHPTSKYAAVEQIRLYDTQGRMVLQKKYAGNLSIAHLATGIYYYEVVIDDAMLPSQSEHPVRGKIIKQ